MPFKTVCFDLGDTLILTDRWDYDKCLTELLKSLQSEKVAVSISFEEFRPVYFEVRNQMYLKNEESLEEVDFNLRISETLKRFNYNFNPENSIVTRAVEAFINVFVKDVRIENYLRLLLKRLEKEYKLGLVSNFAYAPGVWRILDRFNLASFFDAVVVSGELGLRKPHPKIFEEALKMLDVMPAEAVFVGDSLKADIYGAKSVGFKTVLVENVGLRKNPHAIAGELDPFPVEPDAKIPDLRGLLKALESLQLFYGT